MLARKIEHMKPISRIKIDDYMPESMRNSDSFITIKKDINSRHEDLSSIINKEADIKLKTNGLISGVIKSVSRDEDGDFAISLVNGDWKKRTIIKFNNVESIDVSIYPYYSMEHLSSLRMIKRPRREFRYSNKQLKDLLDKYVMINYDGKKIEGRVSNVSFNNVNESIIIIELDTLEEKEVPTYRLRELEVLGSSIDEYNLYKRIREFENETLDELNYYKNFQHSSEYSLVNPVTELEKYFEAIIDYHNGKEINLSEYDYDWVDEIKELFDGDKSDELYSIEIDLAVNVNEYYNDRKAFIRNAVQRAEDIDWTIYGVKQKSGEKEALMYLYESDIIYN